MKINRLSILRTSCLLDLLGHAQSEFDLTTCDPYFTIFVKVFMNHILAENKYFTNHIEQTEDNIMVLNPPNKYQIIWQCHNIQFPASSISLLSKIFVNIFYRARNKLQRQDKYPFKYLFTTWFTEKYFLKLCSTCTLKKFQYSIDIWSVIIFCGYIKIHGPLPP